MKIEYISGVKENSSLNLRDIWQYLIPNKNYTFSGKLGLLLNAHSYCKTDACILIL